MRYLLIALWMLFGSVTSAMAQVSIGIGVNLPGVSIGINLPAYPELVLVPGYPVYYAPHLQANFFFYDGLYWVYQADNWYASSWYNGPWGLVAPEVVPLFVLRIPVRYYRNPPGYFRGWQADAPPRWNEHWGQVWEQRRGGWNQWDRRALPTTAPLPVYQRQYSGDRYPREVQQQQTLHNQNYRYQPHDTLVRQHYQEQAVPRAAAPSPAERGPQGAPQERSSRQPEQERQRSSPPAQPQQGGAAERRPDPQPGAQQRPTSRQENSPQGRGASQEPGRGQRQERGTANERDNGEGRGQDRNR
jgi:hypothetical protein